MRKAAEASFTVFGNVKHSPDPTNISNLPGLRYPPFYNEMEVNLGEVATTEKVTEKVATVISYSGIGIFIVVFFISYMATFAMLLCRYRRHRDRVRNEENVVGTSSERTNFAVEEVRIMHLPGPVNNGGQGAEGFCARFGTAFKNMFCGCCGCCDPPIPPLQPNVLCPDDERPIPRSPNMLIPRDPCTEPPQRCTIAPNGNLGV